MVGVNLKKFVKLDMNNTTNNLDDKYNPKKTEKIKEKNNKNKLKKKMKLKKLSINNKQYITSINHILKDFNKNPIKINRNMKRNNLTSFFSVKKRNDSINVNINKSAFKKRAFSINKNLKEKVNGFTQINYNNKIQNSVKNNQFKRNTYNSTNKNSKNQSLKTMNEISNYFTAQNSKFCFRNEYFRNIKKNLKKIKESYFSLNKKEMIIIKKNEKDGFYIIQKNRKILNGLNKKNRKNKSMNFSLKKNEFLKTKEKIKNKTNLSSVNKIMNTSSNNKKFKKFIDTIYINKKRISTPNSFRKGIKSNFNRNYL